MDAFTQILKNQVAIMEALSQLLPSANLVQPKLEDCVHESSFVAPLYLTATADTCEELLSKLRDPRGAELLRWGNSG